MGYIRTKDGIYDEEKVNLIADAITGEIFVEKIIDSYTSHLEQVIKRAYTPEELCDEFVIVDLLGIEKPILIIKSVVREMMRRTTNTQIYGAIWTSKGLIYVAKMNDKGDLELI